MIKPEIVTLQDLVRWSLMVAVLGWLLMVLFGYLRNYRKSKRLKKRRRRCSQCGLREEIEKGEPKFGTCEVCGGVTTRGRLRKLG